MKRLSQRGAILLLMFSLLILMTGIVLLYRGMDAQVDSPTVQSSTLPLHELWCLNTEHNVSRPLYSNGFVYALDAENPATITAYDSMTGNIMWTAKVANEDQSVGTRGYWSIDGNIMAVGSGGSVSVFDASTGHKTWEHQIWNSGFATGDGKLFVSGPEKVTAFDIETGKTIWETEGPGRGWYIAPFYDPSNNVVVFNDSSYRLQEPDTGAILLKLPRLTESKYSYEPNGGQVHNGLLLYIDEAFEISSGKLVHPRTIPGAHSYLPFIDDNHLFVSNFSYVIDVNLSSFVETWQYVAPKNLEVVGDPVALDDAIYIILSDASIRALDKLTGSEIGIWHGDAVVDRRFGNSPLVPAMVASENMLFASFGTHRLCAFSN